MESKKTLMSPRNPYLSQFTFAQVNLAKFIEEDRLNRRIQKSRQRLSQTV